MRFRDGVRNLLSAHPDGLTPQEIRDLIKENYPILYGTESHRKNVEKGHFKDLDHAVLAQIYVVQKNASDMYSDRSQKPMKVFLVGANAIDSAETDGTEDTISTEVLENLERGIGTLYILGTNLYTENRKEIVKIGITTGTVENRINQLYNTSVPYRFRVIQEIETTNYSELEQAMHKIFDPYRINRSREFFTEECLEFVSPLIDIHMKIASVKEVESL
ncbi:GIY-YIG nuclease family protein [Microbulbifer sp. SSSA007]|uniref:GIY-YIG nuclease family protein n=1 Tax=Microbulbifer sp. SSSA007 TaxID=3243379 RepID=UPI004039C1A9